MPDIYAPIVRHILAPLDAHRSGSDRYAILERLRQSQYFPPARLRELALVKLNRIVAYAFENCRFYRERYSAAGYQSGDWLDEESILQLPLLTKEDIQEYAQDMVSSEYSEGALLPNQTGGSTGKPLKFFLDAARADSRAAATLRHDEWAGVFPGDKVGVLWGAPRDFVAGTAKQRWRNRLIDRKLYLDATSVTPESMREFNKQLSAYRPKALLAYAHTLAVLAEFLESEGLQPHAPESVITSAELLSDSERELIEQVFQTKVFDRYGCREMSVVASECEAHDGLHINSENIFVEILHGGKPAEPGEPGELILTDLENRGMPLIRYKIEDSAGVVTGACSCGRTLPRLRMTGGRVNEFLVTGDNRLVAGTALTIFLLAETPGIGQMQIYQRERGKVTFRIVKDNAGFEERILLEKAKTFLGEETQVAIEYCEQIARESSGKYRFSISEVAGEFLSRK